MTSNERIRELIRAELAKHHPIEVARNSLELLTETSLVKADAAGGSALGEEQVEEAVREAVAKLRRKHPTLFRTPASDAVPGSAGSAEKAGESSAGPIGTSAESPANRARDWLRLDSDVAPSVSSDPGIEPTASGFGTSFRAYASRAKELGQVLAAKARDRRGTPLPKASPLKPVEASAERPLSPSRFVYAGIAGVLALSALAWMWPDAEPKPGARTAAVQTAKPPPSRPPAEPRSTGSVPKPAVEPASARAQPSETPSVLKGVAEVVDTATLRIEGKVARLFGVEWARGGQPEDLTRYLRGREVECRLVTPPDVYRCQVEAQDLSRVVLFNGGGRATADAPPELAAAESQAKKERVGVWRK